MKCQPSVYRSSTIRIIQAPAIKMSSSAAIISMIVGAAGKYLLYLRYYPFAKLSLEITI